MLDTNDENELPDAKGVPLSRLVLPVSAELFGVPFDMKISTTQKGGNLVIQAENVMPPMRMKNGNLEIYPSHRFSQENAAAPQRPAMTPPTD